MCFQILSKLCQQPAMTEKRLPAVVTQQPRGHPALLEKEASIITQQPEVIRSADDAAAEFIDILRTAEKGGDELQRRLKNIVTVNSWTEELAKRILRGIEGLVNHPETVSLFVRDAIDKSNDVAASVFEFAKEHPELAVLFGTIVALGVLVITAPWVLEALGFGEAGPIAGKLFAQGIR